MSRRVFAYNWAHHILRWREQVCFIVYPTCPEADKVVYSINFQVRFFLIIWPAYLDCHLYWFRCTLGWVPDGSVPTWETYNSVTIRHQLQTGVSRAVYHYKWTLNLILNISQDDFKTPGWTAKDLLPLMKRVRPSPSSAEANLTYPTAGKLSEASEQRHPWIRWTYCY